MKKTKFTSYKEYLYGVLFSRTVKKTHTDQSILATFFVLLLKRSDSQTFKYSSSKNPFLQCVCYCYNLLRLMFFILCDNWKTLFSIKLSVTLKAFPSTMLLRSLKEVF